MLATLIPLVVGISSLVGSSLRPRPTLDEVCDLARAQRFDEAEARGEDYLRTCPEDSRALLVMAEVALSRPAPAPDRALDRLARIRPDTPELAAWVLVDRGRAFDLLGRHDRSEACWKEALKLDPSAWEAGRRWLDLLTLQGRSREARTVALGRLERETDPRECARLLLRLARLDVDPPDPWMVIGRFEPAVRRGIADLPTALACGLALTSVSRAQDGLPILHRTVQQHPDEPAAWDALMTGLDLAGMPTELEGLFARLPGELRADPRFAKHQGRVEQEARRWSEAARAYRRAWEFQPDNTVGYRLRRALSLAGEADEWGRFDRLVLDYREAFKQVRGLLDPAEAALQDGRSPPAELSRRMAELRERMGRQDEARAWRLMSARGASASPHRSWPSGSPNSPPLGGR
jgi:tetratricopeptide (TPR) repeat protein